MKRTPKQLGVTGLKHSINDKWYDDEIQENLRFPHNIRTYSKMKTDPLISGSLTLIKQFMKKVRWSVTPKGGVDATPLAIERAEAIEKALFYDMDRSFDQVVTDIITFVENGFSFHEPTYRIKDGMITWKDFSSRHASTIKDIKIDPHSGAITEVVQWKPSTLSLTSPITSGTDIAIPYDRLLHFRADTDRNNPIGGSILKNAYRAWFFKKNLEEIEAIGLERNLNGLPSLKIPSEFILADETEDPEKFAQFMSFVRMLENIRNNEQSGLILPSDRDDNNNLLFDFELLTSSNSGHDPSKVIERYDYRITQSMLTDFIMMGAGSTGSFALSDNKVNTFIQSLEANVEVIAEQFNRKAIKKLYELNNWSLDEMCKLDYEPISSASLTEIGDFFKNAGSIFTPDRGLENWARAKAGAPERDDKQLYLDTPVNVHQANSQRKGMEAAANRKSGSSEDTDTESDEDDKLIEELNKALTKDYRGEA